MADIMEAETHCNTLQHTATHCNTLQHTATHCSILETSQWLTLWRRRHKLIKKSTPRAQQFCLCIMYTRQQECLCVMFVKGRADVTLYVRIECLYLRAAHQEHIKSTTRESVCHTRATTRVSMCDTLCAHRVSHQECPSQAQHECLCVIHVQQQECPRETQSVTSNALDVTLHAHA